MSDRSRVEEEIRDITSRRQEQLNAERDYLRQADDYRSRRDRPSDPSRAFEHQREMDAKATEARRQADKARQFAASADREISNLRSQLSSLR